MVTAVCVSICPSPHSHTILHGVRTRMYWQWYIRVYYHRNETRAPIANPPNNAQREGTPCHSPKLHPGRGVVWECCEGQTDRHTDGRGQYTFVHFVSATPDAKCDNKP